MKDKHFLDTSILIPMIMGSDIFKVYCKKQFGDDALYISKYVQMEFRRSQFLKIIAFYSILDQPEVYTIEDAASIWSNNFSPGDLKPVMRLLGHLAKIRHFDMNERRDKRKALRAIEFYLIRLDIKLRKLCKEIGSNNTRCLRATIQLDTKSGPINADVFRKFHKLFSDVAQCRSKCRVDRFILDRFKTEVQNYINQAKLISNPKHIGNKGFVKMADVLNKIISKGPYVCTCKLCEKIGDAIIALEVQYGMRIEHLDHSFNHLCPPINKLNRIHPSEKALFKKASSSESV